MNVININSTIEITAAQRTFIEELLVLGDTYCHPIMQDSLYWLAKRIPIFLIDEKTMKKHEDPGLALIDEKWEGFPRDDKERLPREKPPMEWLGFYGRDSAGLFEHTPRIAVCPERIASLAGNDEEYLFILALVIVHEFAHAKMDFSDENIKYRKKDEFWRWMEESMANSFTIEIFEVFRTRYRKHYAFGRFDMISRNDIVKGMGDRMFEFIVDFVRHQPPEYALGYVLYDKGIERWWDWRNHKSELGGQKKMDAKMNWLEYVQRAYNNINKKNINQLFDALFHL